VKRLLAILAVVLAGPAAAHGDAAHEAAQWTFDPWVVVPLAAFAVACAIGAMRLGVREHHAARGQRATAALAWLSLAGALVSPLHWLGERVFTFHMIEHEIVMVVAAPLFVIARPVGLLLWSLPHGARLAVGGWMAAAGTRAAWGVATRPAVATIAHGVAIWVWHIPAVFDATVDHLLLHRLQHLSFFVTALLFWWAVLRRCDPGAAVCHVFATMMHTSVLGALIALAPRPLYLLQTASAPAWGMTPLEDQQLAGLVMWVPAGTVYAGFALYLAARWIRRLPSRAEPA
jgi:putative membrane protein